MSKCPRCFSTLPPDLYAYECAGQCPLVFDPIATSFAGGTEQGRNIAMQPIRSGDPRRGGSSERVDCPICGGPTLPVCPTCHVQLMAGWREANTICIALAGARATGKSVYLAILVKQLRNLLTEMGSVSTFANEESRVLYETHYERPLYEARGIMAPTAAANVGDAYSRVPMILSLGIPKGSRTMLVFRDVAGEDLERPEADVTYLSYFQRADAVYFLFDPSAVADVRDLLRDFLPPQLNEVGDPERVLETLLRLIGGAPIPIAMILSKFDTIQALQAVEDDQWSRIMSNVGAASSRDPGIFSAAYDREDAALLHEELRSLLYVLHAQRFVNELASSQGITYNHHFFSVSALGEAASGAKLHSRGIAPYRCLDPVRWVLNSRGLL